MELAIKKILLTASQRMIAVNGQAGGEAKEEGWGINPAAISSAASASAAHVTTKKPKN
jgi:hypothetical protein